jgi:hypothetical protein
MRLITGFAGACWQDRHAVMLGQIRIGRIKVQLIAVGLGHAAAQVVRNQDLARAPK